MPSPSRKHSRAKNVRKSRKCDIKGWQKEKREHPWATKKQAKQIACDHNRV